MGNVGLLYVGAVLFIIGCALLGWVRGNGAVPLNIFVGLLQVITPTYLIFTANGDADVIFGASGLYLFGFTYLYVAMNTIWGFEGTGLGFFSLFVAIAAVGYAVVNVVSTRTTPSPSSGCCGRTCGGCSSSCSVGTGRA